jgi:hypothetical protein
VNILVLVQDLAQHGTAGTRQAGEIKKLFGLHDF